MSGRAPRRWPNFAPPLALYFACRPRSAARFADRSSYSLGYCFTTIQYILCFYFIIPLCAHYLFAYFDFYFRSWRASSPKRRMMTFTPFHTHAFTPNHTRTHLSRAPHPFTSSHTPSHPFTTSHTKSVTPFHTHSHPVTPFHTSPTYYLLAHPIVFPTRPHLFCSYPPTPIFISYPPTSISGVSAQALREGRRGDRLPRMAPEALAGGLPAPGARGAAASGAQLNMAPRRPK